MLVIAENPSQFETLRDAFARGSQANREQSRNTIAIAKENAEKELAKRPLKKREVVNRMSLAISQAPDIITLQGRDKNAKMKNPKNLASGLGYGTLSLAKGVALGIGGIVYEPFQGAKKGGLKGFGVGIGKGLIGVVAQPTAGVVGFVGHTVQGTVNTPGTIAKAVKGSKKKENEEQTANSTAEEAIDFAN